MILFEAADMEDAMAQLKATLASAPEVLVKGQLTKEFCGVTVLLDDPYACILENEDTKYYKYLVNEQMMYMLGTDSAKDMARASKFWLRLQGIDGKIHSNYGRLLFHTINRDGDSQFKYAFDCLCDDQYSRQAVITYNDINCKYRANKDVVCTLSQQFMIRSDSDGVQRLNCHVTMRSNDLFKGFRYDVPWFCFTQQLMLVLLKPYYPYVKMGKYYHTAHSMHVYEKDFNRLGLDAEYQQKIENLKLMELK